MDLIDGITDRRPTMTEEELKRVIAQAQAEYDRIIAEAKANRNRIISPAVDEYRRIDAEAEAEYMRIDAEAEAEYRRIEARVRDEYRRVVAEANAKRVRQPIANEEQRSVYKKVESVAIANFRSAVINHPGSGIAAQRIRKQAQTEYDQAIAQALAEYKRATGEDYKP